MSGPQEIRDHLNSLIGGSFNRSKPTSKGGALRPLHSYPRVFKRMECKDEKDKSCQCCDNCTRVKQV